MHIKEMLDMAAIVSQNDMCVRIKPIVLHFEPTRRPLSVNELNLKTGFVHGPEMLFWHPATMFRLSADTRH